MRFVVAATFCIRSVCRRFTCFVVVVVLINQFSMWPVAKPQIIDLD